MILLKREYKELEEIQEKIIKGTVKSNEITIFLGLIVKSGNKLEMLEYMQTIGFNSIEEVQEHFSKNKKNTDLTAGLVIAGGAILLALLLSR
ncbi:hypothetical protein [uncultured Gammaproteobacteria bacterium]|jgi:hypothetical protein|nr:hypothetical protein [uncultured Gammaproteobacteria bacterium]SMN16007.1 hypothetical protein CRYPD_829 [uncultured Candidatus Thioglobus sp.]CAC9559228.1 hypothetical protein [uncultured Gammaproteobacteria bacterium]CAC9561443.1 hypothetical protein [uncultured Gammaproteobacteria bacterium]CAC9565861.1 hypothetical protein [uncultured Gammaproteobacteria bacterium]